MPNFEGFRHRRTVTSTKPEGSIQRPRGILGLNAAAYRLLKEPAAVELLYDRDDQIIGVRAEDPEAAWAYTMRKQKNSQSYVVAAKAFFDYYGISLDGPSEKYSVQMYGDILGIDLKGDRIEVIGSRRKRGDDRFTPPQSVDPSMAHLDQSRSTPNRQAPDNEPLAVTG